MPHSSPDCVVGIEKYLRSVSATVRRKGRMLLEDYGITSPLFDALVVLNEVGKLTIGELSEQLYLAYSTTTDLVDRLEKSRFVVRQRSVDDRRVVQVVLEPAGIELYRAVVHARQQYLESVLEKVSSDARQQILDSLELLHMNMANQ